MATFLIVGENFSAVNKRISQRGDQFILLMDGSRQFMSIRHLPYINADFSSRDSLMASIRKINRKIDGVITMYERYILPAAWIAEELGLPGLDVKAAEACSDKLMMRQFLAVAPKAISPRFARAKSQADILNFAGKYGLPVIIKPANLSKSLLVSKCDTKEELESAWRNISKNIGRVYQKYSPTRQPMIIVEEYMPGSLHSVAGFVGANGDVHLLSEIADLTNGYEAGYDDNFLYSRVMPSGLSPQLQVKVLETARLGVKALGLKNCPVHIEIIVTSKGPRIVEIGARIGGYRERMYLLADGINMIDCLLDNALGQPANVVAHKKEWVASLELFPKISGKFVGITNEQRLKKLSSLVSFSVKQTPGSVVGKSSQGYKMCAIVVLHNKSRRMFNKDLAYVNQKVRVLTA